MRALFSAFLPAVQALLPQRCLICQAALPGSACLCRRCAPPPSRVGAVCCARCAEPGDAALCAPCAELSSALNSTRALWRYAGAVRDVIRVMKYEPSLRLAHWSAQRLGEFVDEHYCSANWDLCVSVPHLREHNRRRGFDLCAAIVAEVCACSPRCGQPLQALAFQREPERAQARLDLDARLKRARQRRFALIVPVVGAKILLIDDVATTGLTAECAGQALLSAGAHSVDFVALARSPRWAGERFRVQKTMQKEMRALYGD